MPIKFNVSVSPIEGKGPIKVEGVCTIESGDVKEVTWDWGDGTPKTFGKIQSHTYQNEGIYSIHVFIAGIEGSSRKPDNVTKQYDTSVKVLSDPAPSVSLSNYTIKEGFGIDFTYKILDNGSTIVSEEWSFPGGTPSSWSGRNLPTIRYERAGNFTATVTVRGSNGKLSSAPSQITVTAVNKVVQSLSGLTKLSSAVEAHRKDEIQFVRFSDDNFWIVSYKNGYQSFGDATMNSKLAQYNSSGLRPATYIGNAGKWAIFYGNLGYSWQSCPLNLTNKMTQFYNESKTPIRLDFDNGNNWVYWAGSSISWSHSSQPALVSAVLNLSNAKGFTFGYNNNVNTWLVFSSYNFTASTNVPSDLVNTLNSIKSQSREIIDVEMQGTNWVVIYR